MSREETFASKEIHREFAIRSNGRIWELLEKENRTPPENDELLYAAYASCFHWLYAGTAVNQQRGEYLIAKAYISLEMSEPALYHAHKCLALTQENPGEMQDFDIAYAYEVLARAYAMNKNTAAAQKYLALTQEAGQQIQAPKDKEIFDNDLKNGPWFGLVENGQ